MKKILLSTILFFFASTIEAQMYVSPTSYVYVNDQFVYVTQDVNLANTGNFYLRNQSQLLQGTAGAGANVGLGNLSVYQEGTTNNFQYNYWCSPVGVPEAAAGNSNFGITRLFRPSAADKVTSTAATILPINNFNGVATNSSLSIAQKWIWTYEAENIYAPGNGGWVFAGAASTVRAGLGFTMKGTSGSDNLVSDINDGVQNKPNANFGQRYDFRGKPNDGNMTAAVSNAAGTSYDNMTLVGNPYPSAINLNYYLMENAGYTVNATTGAITGPASGGTIDGNAYFWEHDKATNTHYVSGYVGGYGTYAPNGSDIGTPGTYTVAPFLTYAPDGESTTGAAGSGNSYTRQYTPVGQGFMVKGSVAPPAVATMRNRYRIFIREGAANNSQFEKTANANKISAVSPDNWEEIPNVAGTDYTQLSKLPVPQFKIHTRINDGVVYETAIAFNDITTDDFDIAFDAKSTYAQDAKTSYFPLSSGEKVVITTLPFDIDKKIPIAFKSDESASFEVNVSELINFNLSSEIYLHDKVNDVYYDILNSDFVIVLPAGENTTQYEVTFKMDTALAEETHNVVNSFQVYQNNVNSMLTIVNPLNKDVVVANIYDVTGKLIIAKQNLGDNQKIEIPTEDISEGVYIVNLTTKDNFKVDKKVIVKK